MGWTDWVMPALIAGTTIYSLFADSPAEDANAMNQQIYEQNQATTQQDWEKLFNYWMGQQAHWGQQLAAPMQSPTWAGAQAGIGRVFGQQKEQLGRELGKRGLTGGAVGEAMTGLQQSQLQNLEQILTGIMTNAEKNLYGTPPPTHGQAQSQAQYPKYNEEPSANLNGLLPLVNQITKAWGSPGGSGGTGNNTGGGISNNAFANWYLSQMTPNYNF